MAKNSSYKKPARWVNLNEEKTTSRDADTASDYEEDSTRSHTESHAPDPNNYNKLFTVINEIKTTLASDKIDNVLEYVKSIDSDTKNTLELINKENKSLPEESFTSDQLKEMIKQSIDHDSILSVINKMRVKMESFVNKFDLYQTDLEVMQIKLDTIMSQQLILLKHMNKLQLTQLTMQMTCQELHHGDTIERMKEKPVELVDPGVNHVDPVEQIQDVIVEPTETINEKLDQVDQIDTIDTIDTIEKVEHIECVEDDKEDELKYYKTSPVALPVTRSVPVRKTIKKK